LHKLFLVRVRRYSEDIDLVQLNAGPIGPVMNAIRAQLDSWLGKPKWKQNRGRVTLIYRFRSEIPPTTPLRLKIEINTREHFTVFGLYRAHFAVSNPWYAGEAEVVSYAVEELLGTKMRALYQRKKGRDLFDLATAMDRLPHLDHARIVRCFEAYLANEGARVSRAEFEANLVRKLDDPDFLKDLQPLLASEASSDPSASDALQQGRAVLQNLIAQLPGQAWKGDSGKVRSGD
ncbi:MAG: nucleotidyl transferase AbiEii/AbiGii toxin family protein, partial [bacterium]|nr:nucleotidyl transferase AbiEii/AbiGii toxin family protein [bacterium]